MHLAQVIAALPVTGVRGPVDVEVSDVGHDSRQVNPGTLFCCVRGATADGHAFAPAAVRAGATALLVDHELPTESLPATVTQVVVPDVRAAMAPAAARCWGQPSRQLTVVAVTGTNGKTTTTFLLRNIFAAAGWSSDVLGTLSGARTTPEAPDLQRWLAARRDAGVQAVAMEVSSHALDLHRVDGTWFAAAAFTNLTRDHLDHHVSMDAYFAAKARLFTPAFTERAVVNVDDPYGARLADEVAIEVHRYGLADADGLTVGAAGSRFRWRDHPVELRIGGRFNVANALAAAEVARVVGIEEAAVADGLSRPVVVPGRFELVDEGQPFRVLVDYAHTPDGLEQVLRAARELAGDHRVHVVFGCGGDRDATKRPAMGAAAAQGAHAVIVTADNSRTEATRAIISAVADGFERAPDRLAATLVVEEDRDAAIGTALGAAVAGDVVVIAGKGHETTQTIGESVIAFDDREVARRHLRASLGLPGAAS